MNLKLHNYIIMVSRIIDGKRDTRYLLSYMFTKDGIKIETTTELEDAAGFATLQVAGLVARSIQNDLAGYAAVVSTAASCAVSEGFITKEAYLKLIQSR